VAKDQIPFATSLALNKAADVVVNDITQGIRTNLDKPTRFTELAFKTQSGRFKGIRATKKNLVARIIPGEAQSTYLKYQVHGGSRRANRSKIAVPTRNVKLNKFGNVPGRRSGLIKNPNQFAGEIKGIDGIWERYGKKKRAIRLLHGFSHSVRYEKRMPLYKISRDSFAKNFRKIFIESLNYAMKTAK